MMTNKFTKEHIERLQENATKAYHKYVDFETYWSERIVYRMDQWIPFAGYWDAVKLIQQQAWDREAELERQIIR